MATVEAVGSPANGDYWPDAFVKAQRLAASGIGVIQDSISLTVTGGDLGVTIPAFCGVAPDGAGVLYPFLSALITLTHDAGEAAGPRIDLGVYDKSDATMKIVKGTATEETGDVAETPTPHTTSDQVLIYQARIEQNAAVLAVAAVKGRAIAVRTQTFATTILTRNNSAALTDVPAAKFAMGPNQTWAFEFKARATIGATPDIKAAFTGPSGFSGTGHLMKRGTASLAAADVTDYTAATAVADANAGIEFEAIGTLASSSAAGLAQLQIAQNTATGEDTIIQPGVIVARRLA